MPDGKYFKLCMDAIVNYDPISDERDHEHERFADVQLALAAGCEMRSKLKKHRDSGRYGWWDKNTCSLEDLRAMRDKALVDDDHVSVLNFTSMIAIRDSK